jgi:hypothetical protein
MSNINETRIVLGSLRYKSATNTNISINVPLNGNQKEMDEFERNSRISLAQVYDDERQKSGIFRPTVKIDLVYYNGYSGTTGINGADYFPFTNNLYHINAENSFSTQVWSGYPQFNEFEFIRNDNNVVGYTKPSGSTPPHVYFENKKASTYNWTHYISYPYANDGGKFLQYYDNNGNSLSWVASAGIPFTITNPYNYNGQNLISFVCPVKHNLSVGEYVRLYIPGWTGASGQTIFEVYSLGQEGYNSDEYVFNIYNIGFDSYTFPNQLLGTFRRIIDIKNSAETTSTYYIRKHKIITNVNDAVLNRAAFECNAFNTDRQYEYSSLTPDNVAKITQREGNQSYLLNFSRDIDISGLIDNLKRPISELFVTTINKGYFGWFNRPINIFQPNYPAIKFGYGFNITTNLTPYWSSLNQSVNLTTIPTDFYTKTIGSTTFTFYYNQDFKVGDIIDGAFCEYNQIEQEERVISDYYHKFIYNDNLFRIGSLTTNPNLRLNPNGFYYKPHTSIQIRTFSEYIEDGNIDSIDSAPNYSFYSQYQSKLLWRDIYTYGFISRNGVGVDYPFINGAHYPTKNIVFRVFPEGNVPQEINQIADPIIDGCE